MNLNVFYWSYSKRYYLLHPWKWIEDLGYNIKAAYQRAVHGYADRDLFSWDSWFLSIAPAMLKEIAACKCGGYPGIFPFETPEKWETWLQSIAARLEALQEQWTETRNEYDEPYFDMLEKYRVETNENGNHIIKYEGYKNDTELEYLWQKWLNRSKELNEQQYEETKAVFVELAAHLYQIWI